MRKGRKISGGKYKKQKKRKLYEAISKPRTVALGPVKKKTLRGRGGIIKTVLLSADEANILDTKTKKSKKGKIKNVIETPSNRFLARQNIIVKGAIIETEFGKARVTNHPGKEPTVQAVLIKE